MGTNPSPRNKQARLDKKSLSVDEPTDDALALLENALRGDEPSLWDGEHTEGDDSLPEENARL